MTNPKANYYYNRREYGKALEIDPEHYFALTAMGEIYRQSGEYEKGLDCFKKALEINSDLIDAWHGLGKVYEELGDVAKVDECFQNERRLKRRRRGRRKKKATICPYRISGKIAEKYFEDLYYWFRRCGMTPKD